MKKSYFAVRYTEFYDGYEFSSTVVVQAKNDRAAEKRVEKDYQRTDGYSFGKVESVATEITEQEYNVLKKYC